MVLPGERAIGRKDPVFDAYFEDDPELSALMREVLEHRQRTRGSGRSLRARTEEVFREENRELKSAIMDVYEGRIRDLEKEQENAPTAEERRRLGRKIRAALAKKERARKRLDRNYPT